MAKTKISEYSSTANSNTDIASINIDEGCAPSGINNAIRALMAQLKDWQSGAQDVYITPAGSVSAPAVTTNGDTNTGVYFPAADKIALATGGTQAVIVDASQNVGIGTSSPSYRLDVQSTGDVWARVQNNTSGSGSARLLLQNNGDSGFAIVNNSGASGAVNLVNYKASVLGFFTDSSERMRIDSSGNVGIGTSSPAYKVQLTNSAASNFVSIVSGTSNTAGVLLGDTDSATVGRIEYDNANNFMSWYTNGSERARIDSSGNLLVGTTSANVGASTGMRVVSGTSVAERLELGSASSSNSQVGFDMYSTGAGAYRFYVGYGGTIYATSTTITGISDQRLKENIRDLDDGLDKIMALQPRKFDWKNGKGKGIANDRGFIAQEFEQVFPDMIEEWQDPAPEGEEPYKAVNANLIPTLVKAIQELKAIVDAQAVEIAALKGQA